ncbi:sex-lethal, partial [Reticulomyxa filosa]
MHNKRIDSRSHETLLVKHAYRKVRNNKRIIRVGKEDVEMIMNKNTNNVYLRCLPQNFTEKDLNELCSPFGQLTCTRVRENGVAFVRFRQPENAQQAIRELNGKLITGSQRPLLAKLANSF